VSCRNVRSPEHRVACRWRSEHGCAAACGRGKPPSAFCDGDDCHVPPRWKLPAGVSRRGRSKPFPDWERTALLRVLPTFRKRRTRIRSLVNLAKAVSVRQRRSKETVNLVHDLAECTQPRQAAGDPLDCPALGGSEVVGNKQMPMLEQITDLSLQTLVAPGRPLGLLAARRPRPSGVFLAASCFRTLLTARSTALVISATTWNSHT